LYKALVDKQLATEISTDYGLSFDPFLFSFYAIAGKGINESNLEKAIYVELEKIKKEGVG